MLSIITPRWTLRIAFGLLVVAVVGAGIADLPVPSPHTGAFQVHSYLGESERDPTVAVAPGGDFLVAWKGGPDLFIKQFDREGVSTGPESAFYVPGNRYPDLTAVATGGFVLAWEETTTVSSAIVLSRLDSSGEPLGNHIEAEWVQDSIGYVERPAVAADAMGEFTVVWAATDETWEIRARRYRHDGTPHDVAFQVNTYTALSQVEPRIAMSPGGESVIVWQSAGQDGGSWGVFGQLYDALGDAVGSEFRVNSWTVGAQRQPSVSMDAEGNFVTVWNDVSAGFSTIARCFDSEGVPLGDEFSVGGPGRHQPRVVLEGAGSFVVLHSGEPDGGGADRVFGRRMRCDATGSDEFEVSTVTTWHQAWPRIDRDAQGNFVAIWTGQVTPDGEAVDSARVYCAPLGVAHPVDDSVCLGGTASFSVAAAGREPLAYRWRRNGIELVDGGGVSGAALPVLVVAGVSEADAGLYDCVVQDACGNTRTIVSLDASLTVIETTPGVVGDSLRVDRDPQELAITWQDVTGADDYVVFSDMDPSGTFAAVEGTATNGSAGVTILMPEESLYFLAAARNDCGTGP